MEMIRGRSLSEVRRYDLWKLLIAALLFVNALFICGKPAPQAELPKAELPRAELPRAELPRAAVAEASKTVAPVAATSLAAGYFWAGDKLVLTGNVKDEAARKAIVDEAVKVMGSADKVVDQLKIDASAPAPIALPKPPNAKLYFANNKVDVPADVSKSLREVIAWAKAAPSNKLAISGYHSASGSLERNHELAKGRANEVASILKHAGVPDTQIELRKPLEELGGADPAQARRVEVGPAQ